MDFDFADKHLIEFYQTGKSKKLKLGKDIAKGFVERVGRIAAAVNINDLWTPPSMKFEKMKGYDNRFSIRINKQYRLEFSIEFTDESKTEGQVLILTISNHYE